MLSTTSTCFSCRSAWRRTSVGRLRLAAVAGTLAAGAALAVATLSAALAHGSAPIGLRVGILSRHQPREVEVSGERLEVRQTRPDARWQAALGHLTLRAGPSGGIEAQPVARAGSGMRLTPGCEIRAAGPLTVKLESTASGAASVRLRRRYHGRLTVGVSGGKLELVVHLPLEHYVAGVVAAEAESDDREPLRALAVAARSYALFMRGRHAAEGFDLCDLAHCQTFAGTADRRPAAAEAAAATSGQVLRHQGRLVEAVHTSACGGSTAAAADVWPGRGQPYLTAVSCEDCRLAPHYRWQAVVPLAGLEAALRAEGLRPGTGRAAGRGPEPAQVVGIRVVERSSGGFVRRLVVEWRGSGPRPSRTGLSGEALRLLVGRHLGWSHLWSARFSVETVGDRLRFSGRGAGHGVGLCQWGTVGLARAGLGYRRILARYYPGTELETIY